ncbi:MAG: molybdopterin molybdotransferase [Clostridia bacterium]|jgi:molybdopterin molybdotransferase|nr:molybdopterin molybdotransferase [Clostridia bacterium]MDN5323486.1 molybdopterin molybdotransferase [Clostridia bacterium]
MFKGVQLEEAQKLLLEVTDIMPSITISLEKALGKVLAEGVFAPINVPHFRRSPLDGFALKACDTIGASVNTPRIIEIIDEVQAGDTREINTLPHNCGVKIMTGAPLPLEADVVIKKEDVIYKNNKIYVTEELCKNNNVIFVGSDLEEGQLIFSEGENLGPYHIGVLAALGLIYVKVYQIPEIALISTGNELKNPGEKLAYGQIYNSNLYSLKSLITSLGGEAHNLGIVQDNEEEIKEKISQALNKYQMVLTTGGASVGDYDLIEKVLKMIDASILFNRVAIKPGSPVIAGVKDGKLIIGLSGNPAAALISFELLIRPLIKKMLGYQKFANRYLEAELEDGFSKTSPQRRFLRVRITYENGKWVARQTGKQQSSILRSMVGCNALVDIPRGSGPIAPGSVVKAILLKEELLCYHL